jgi:hypothetical protein
VDFAQVFEQLAGQPGGRCGHADGVRADLGGTAHLLGHRKAALEQLVQRGAQRAGFVGQAHRLLHLAEDLRLAQHHGIEPAGHAEGVPRGVVPVHHVGMLAQVLGAHAALLGQPVQRRLQQRRHAVAGRRRCAQRQVQLGAVAGGDDGRFGVHPLQAVVQPAQRRRQ